MSTVRARETFHHESGTILGGTVLNTDDPMAIAYAPLFELVAEEPRRPVRPPVDLPGRTQNRGTTRV